MDYTKQLSDIEAGLAARASTIAQATGEQAALQAAHDIVTNGYQSDQAVIATAVASQVGDTQAENATLTANATTDAATISDLQGQVTALTTVLANLGYNPDGTQISSR